MWTWHKDLTVCPVRAPYTDTRGRPNCINLLSRVQTLAPGPLTACKTYNDL